MNDHAIFDLAVRDEGKARTDLSISIVPPGDHVETVPANLNYLCVSLHGGVSPLRLTVDHEIDAPAPAETFFFLPAGRTRVLRSLRKDGAVRLSFAEAFIDANPQFEPLRGGGTGQLHTYDRYLVAVAEIAYRHLTREGPPPGPAEIEPLAHTMLTQLVHCLEAPGVPAPGRAGWMQVALDHIEAHLEEDLSLEEIATEAGSSQYHFARRFREHIGMSVRQYITQRRCARAEHLLTKTDHSIAQIAFDVGFASQSHMTTVMRRTQGRTPGEIRRGRAA